MLCLVSRQKQNSLIQSGNGGRDVVTQLGRDIGRDIYQAMLDDDVSTRLMRQQHGLVEPRHLLCSDLDAHCHAAGDQLDMLWSRYRWRQLADRRR